MLDPIFTLRKIVSRVYNEMDCLFADVSMRLQMNVHIGYCMQAVSQTKKMGDIEQIKSVTSKQACMQQLYPVSREQIVGKINIEYAMIITFSLNLSETNRSYGRKRI